MAETFVCATCGQEHAGLLMDIAYHRPAAYFRVPATERENRVQATADMCVIDEQAGYIRGVLALPVPETAQTFRWGVWAGVSRADFKYYYDHWYDQSVEGLRELTGQLSGDVGPYAASAGLEVNIQLLADNQRPLFFVVSDEHPLGRDQRQGITMHRVMEFVEPLNQGGSRMKADPAANE